MQNNILISIIIPTCNRNELLRICLEKLTAAMQNFSQEEYEIIVSDDGREAVKIKHEFATIKFVEGPQNGPAANRNNGAKKAMGEWLLFLDDDCIPDSQLLVNYKKAINNNPEINVFEGKIYVDTPKNSLGVTSPVNLTGGYLWACNFMIRKDYFFQIDGFDERFPYAAMEDVDLNYKIAKSDNKVVFIENASVCHPWRKKGGWKKVMNHNKSTWIYLEKHPEERKRINAWYYFKFNTKLFLYETVPGLIKYKGRGFKTAIIEHVGFLVMGLQLLIGKRKES